ncbi:penicillin-binding transpeptidase domain-containing protein [Nesterenkonia massiliensis]|uniref:Beta-lactamase n=1 Tax=Nesterenkonia massiliensis TaxID=1232429 RepID=A0ABT2HQ45_9MICC|nr:penicillin-binding transpeptidase domain-containing protein [Nesterenkonia massiliensis]MCT1606817.1 penicillin-binding transpeptidase domain-containing protein [Nesterenkonia massiliensis]
MNHAIRHIWIVSVTLFVALFAALSLIQVVLTDELNANQKNSRQIIATAGSPRGPITVDGEAIALSVPAENSPYDYQRVYRDAELYSGITGFYSTEGGSSGLESALNDYLSGQSDSQFFDRISALFTGDSMQGAQVELTLNGQWQRMAFDMIPDGLRGTIIVTDLTTGDIKVMASRPSYDTNELAVHSRDAYLQNLERIEATPGLTPHSLGPIRNRIAPGSTFKLVDTLAMLESGDYDPDTELENPPSIQLPQSVNELENLETGNCYQRQEAEFRWIFAQSCNTPFAEAGMDLGQQALLEAAESFWFNQELTIPLYVTPSHFPEEEISDAALALSAIGQQDVGATALQINMLAAAIGNEGTLMRPQLVDTIRGTDLQVLSQPSPEVLNEVMSPDVAAEITEMMVETVESGTGWRAQSSRFDVAAKTGTAEIGDGEGLVNSWITGFAPADNPQYAVTVVYERLEPGVGNELTGPQMLAMLEAVIGE